MLWIICIFCFNYAYPYVANFPKGKGVAETRTWLDAEGFEGKFMKWKADALLGADKDDILKIVPGEDGMRLWGLLNTARNQGM